MTWCAMAYYSDILYSKTYSGILQYDIPYTFYIMLYSVLLLYDLLYFDMLYYDKVYYDML